MNCHRMTKWHLVNSLAYLYGQRGKMKDTHSLSRLKIIPISFGMESHGRRSCNDDLRLHNIQMHPHRVYKPSFHSMFASKFSHTCKHTGSMVSMLIIQFVDSMQKEIGVQLILLFLLNDRKF